MHDVRLSVSRRVKLKTVISDEDSNKISEKREEDDDGVENDDWEEDVNLLEAGNDDWEEDVNLPDTENDDWEKDVNLLEAENDDWEEDVKADDLGEDYSEDEDEEEDEEDNICFEDLKETYGSEGGSSNTTNIYVNQSFVSKDALVLALRLIAVKRKFSFRIFKSTKLYLWQLVVLMGVDGSLELV
ncbi:hypothetical protein N665_0010s0030 [Sinapis alba]|nr:hypothetical protein N665_0010s0030 [Sinapis alba]